MKNYEIKKTSAPNIFTLEDESGKPVADIRGENNAILFSHLPELLEFLDAFAREDERLCTSDGLHLQEKLKQYRK